MFSPGDDDLDVIDEEKEDLMDEEIDAEDEERKDSGDEEIEGFEPGATEASSFPALVCLALNSDGTNPDIRKLIELDQLTTVQDVTATVVQLAFQNGDTVRFDFSDDDEAKADACNHALYCRLPSSTHRY